MSMAALLRATLDTLRSSVPGLSSSNSRVTYDARPPAANAAMFYLCIYPSSWRPGPSADIHEAIEDVYGITLAINMRTSVIPKDRWGQEAYLSQTRSIEQAARELRFAMHKQRYPLLKLANEFAGIDTNEGVQMVEPLLFDNAPLAPEPMAAEWFYAQPEGDMPVMPDIRHREPGRLRKLQQATSGAPGPLEHHGLLMEMVYTGGRRIQPLETPFQITVTFLATENTSPPITGTYTGIPEDIQVTIDGQTYTPNFDNGIWSIAAGTITLAVGVYDVEAEATYDGGATIVKDETINEVQILDPNESWGWTTGEAHVWTDGTQAAWTQ